MANQDEFQTNLLKTIAAELYFLCGMQAAREMMGKSYFSLGQAEKASVDQLVMGMVTINFQGLTPEFLQGLQTQKAQGLGNVGSGGDKVQ